MTAILALETATDVVGCAVGIAGGPVRASMLVGSERSHGEMLAPMIQAVLAEAEMSIADIDLIAIDCGPGRYTGLRVGIATAATLAYARSLPVAAVSSTELLAFGARNFNGYIVPVVDARRGEVFYGVYRAAGYETGSQGMAEQNHRCPEEIVPPKVGNSTDVAAEMSQHEGKKLLLGDGVLEVGPTGEAASEEIAGGKVVAARPSPSSLAVLAAQKAQAGQVCEYSDLKSLYLRQPDINTARKSTAGDKTDISAGTTRKAVAP